MDLLHSVTKKYFFCSHCTIGEKRPWFPVAGFSQTGRRFGLLFTAFSEIYDGPVEMKRERNRGLEVDIEACMCLDAFALVCALVRAYAHT